MAGFLATAYRGLLFVGYGFMNFTSTKRSQHWRQQRLDSISSQPFNGRIMVLTGANSGLGLETARQWYLGGGICYMLCRSRERGEEAMRSILEAAGVSNTAGRLHLFVVDVSRPPQLVEFIRQFRNQLRGSTAVPYIDVLVNNAGILPSERRLTAEGLEESFATNVIGPYILTKGLMPLLRQSPTGGRVINVSSGGMLTSRLDPSDLQCSRLEKWDGSAVYAHQKRLLCYWTAVEAAQHQNQMFFASTHPGWVDTPGVRSSIPDFFRTFQPYLRDLVEGVDTVLWLGGSETDSRDLVSGEFWFGTRSSEQEITQAIAELNHICEPYLNKIL